MTTIQIDGPLTGQGPLFDTLLRGLEEWFGLEAAILEYVERTDREPTFVARQDGAVVGAIALRRHFPAAAEIDVMGVVRDRHRAGIGRQLVEAALHWCQTESIEYLQVKTLSASREYEQYARTRAFYAALGFVPLEELPTLWDENNPCLLSVMRVPAVTAQSPQR